VDKGENYEGVRLDEYALHHIIPNHQVEQLVHKNITEQEIETYINQPHIRKVITNRDLNVDKEKHGKLIHASISNNPHNFVRGPNGDLRFDDPKGKIDDKLLSHQTKDFKDAAKPFVVKTPNNPETLAKFGKLPPTVPVHFDKDPTSTSRKAFYVKKKVY